MSSAEDRSKGVRRLLDNRERRPRPIELAGETAEQLGVTPWRARVLIHQAAQNGAARPVWHNGHARIAPADREQPTNTGYPFTIDSLERSAPDLAHALLQKHGETNAAETAEAFADAARYWDALQLMENHGIDATTTPNGLIVCRACGLAQPNDLRQHLGNHHGAEPDRYRDRHPAAPMTAEERAALPPADIDWR